MSEAVLSTIRAGLNAEPRLGPDVAAEMTLAGDGTLTLVAQVPSVAAKKRALEIAAAPAEVRGVVDRVRVIPATRMKDRAILAHLQEHFVCEPSFQGVLVRVEQPDGDAASPRFVAVTEAPVPPRGRIDIEVRDGVVILGGTVPGRVSQRLAGVMAWWVPGVRDVVNGLVATPAEEDAPIRIEEAVRVVLDRNPWVDDSQIRIGVRGRTVRLTGHVRSAAERDMAEADAWCVLGVDDVENRLEPAP